MAIVTKFFNDCLKSKLKRFSIIGILIAVIKFGMLSQSLSGLFACISNQKCVLNTYRGQQTL